MSYYYATAPTIVQETVVVPQPVYYQQPYDYSTSTLYSTSPTVPPSDATSPYTSEPSPQATTATPAESATTSATPAPENMAGLAGRPASDTGPSGTGRPGTEQSDPRGEQLYVLMFEGTKAFSQGEYDTAARMFLQVTMQDPDNADAALAYAVARFATGDYAISAIAIRRGVRKFGEVVNSGFDIRERYTNKEDFERHFQSLVNFVSQRPDSIDGLMVLGFAEHFTGQRDRAVETFKEIKRRFPADGDVADTFISAKPLAEIQQQEAAEEDASQPSRTGQSVPPAQPPKDTLPAQAPEPVYKEVLPVPPQKQWVPLVPKDSATPSSSSPGSQPSSAAPSATFPLEQRRNTADSVTAEPVVPDLFDLDS